ncbi:AraC family transcriptional regulator with amidase-like domain [Kribbella pratensis]|uniref:AraC family transcriptional regulator with amidase-like domain n=1 Tax=Kribbella pratensis TaxID=2512112 RepID=A0ABY2F4S1_9ACTN|nr:helix-turn-helix domain-containing protein [Kribbella pratensis]TDW79750.1 AraC family transcriptional regulator with amidase-like domain [Kribbella pratensis]
MHRVVALVTAPQASFELGCAAAVFRDPPYRFSVCTEHPGNLSTTEGFDMVVTSGLRALDRADTIVVPGWLPINREPTPAVLRALTRAHRRGARLVSICSGAYLLAATGLLDGRRVATHWRYADELQRRFPAVQVDPDVLYVDHGDVATSGGSGTGIDLCLHLVRRDHGASYAAWVAGRMVMPPHREGGQTQYRSAEPVPKEPVPKESLGGLLDWAVERLDKPITVDDLARRANVSPRTLARRFEQQLGAAPGQWLLAQRIARTRVLLEETDLSVDAIAARVGLSSATNLRRRFRAALHTTPSAYRRAYQGK